MKHERTIQPAPRRPFEVYGFTENECLYWRVNQERFEAILQDEQTFIHEIKESSNSYGEFLFVTTSRPSDQGRVGMSFYGLGHHDYRERWFTKEWYWYQTNIHPNRVGEQIPKEEATELLRQRLEDIRPYIQEPDTQTERGKLFELLADLTDEDGALAEMQDLGNDWEHLMGDIDG